MKEPRITLKMIADSMDKKGSFEAVGICPKCIGKVANFVFDTYPTAIINIYGSGGVFGLSCCTKESVKEEMEKSCG